MPKTKQFESAAGEATARKPSKLAGWALTLTFTAGLSLLALGLSEDPRTRVRDAIAEIALVYDGPSETFRQYCHRLVDDMHPEIDKYLVRQTAKPDHFALTADYFVRSAYTCVFPSRAATVKQVEDQVVNDNQAFSVVSPHPKLPRILDQTIQSVSDHGLPPIEGTPDAMLWFPVFARHLSGNALSHAQVVVRTNTNTVRELGPCGSVDTLYQRMSPATIGQFVLFIGYRSPDGGSKGGSECLAIDESLGPQVLTENGTYMGQYLRRFFASELRADACYSHAGALKDSNEFDFPALRLWSAEVGNMSIADAGLYLSRQLSSMSEKEELLGVKFHTVPFLIGCAVVFLMGPLVIVYGVRAAGVPAINETMAGLSVALQAVVAWVVIAVLPAVAGLLCLAHFRCGEPDIAKSLPIAAAVAFGFGTAMSLVLWRSLRRAARSAF